MFNLNFTQALKIYTKPGLRGSQQIASLPSRCNSYKYIYHVELKSLKTNAILKKQKQKNTWSVDSNYHSSCK